MSREYVPFPEDGVIDTEFGQMQVQHLSDADHPTVTLANKSGSYITVNGVRMRVRVTLINYRDGAGWVFRVDDCQGEPPIPARTTNALSARRVEPKPGTATATAASIEVSAAAKRKIRATLPELFNKWAAGRDDLFTQVRLTTVLDDIRRLNGEIFDAEEQMKALKVQRSDAEAKYSAIERNPALGEIGSGMTPSWMAAEVGTA